MIQNGLPDAQVLPLHILLVDDSAWVMDLYVPALEDLVTTVEELLHEMQTEEELVSRIAASGADVLLLDANLAGGVKGYRLLPRVLEAKPALRCIGFSNDPHYAPHFLQAGAIGFVEKMQQNPGAVVRQVPELLQ